ncbi:hypothetical protein PR048_012808 [Dryococelus australis]|uniref:PiggyBac transposable element-derived protein domain-containing protein n=1 Tax=Dryococelus australis TaxID=614101 RepID=A0ABQ9HR92_9NEOP|nr:hypothetical protein PR048_012808 [Dryococelus australis]
MDLFNQNSQCRTDARNHFAYNMYVYCGKRTDRLGLSAVETKLQYQPKQYCTNVTADNWYSPVSLVQTLKNNGIADVGTLKKIK